VHTLLKRSGVYYLPNSKIPYTGNYFNKNTGEFKQLKDEFSGLKTKYKDGKKDLDINYKNDIRDGVEIKYYSTGQVSLETNYKNGKSKGSVLSWGENGNQIVTQDIK
jgi:antitoxin component YwqK of YwqJK toxin-antitoxin module